MTPEQKAAYINSQAVCAQAKIHRMIADNITAESQHEGRRWFAEDFDAIPDQFGISHNAVCMFFQE